MTVIDLKPLLDSGNKLQNVRILRKATPFQELKNSAKTRGHLGRVDVKLYYLGILRILRFSSLSIEECHNIQPCKRTLRPSRL